MFHLDLFLIFKCVVETVIAAASVQIALKVRSYSLIYGVAKIQPFPLTQHLKMEVFLSFDT